MLNSIYKKSSITISNIPEVFKTISNSADYVTECNKVITEAAKESEEQHRKELVAVLADSAQTKNLLLDKYSGFSKEVEYCSKYLESLGAITTELEKQDQDESTLETTKQVQQLTKNVTSFITLFGKIVITYDKLTDILK